MKRDDFGGVAVALPCAQSLVVAVVKRTGVRILAT